MDARVGERHALLDQRMRLCRRFPIAFERAQRIRLPDACVARMCNAANPAGDRLATELQGRLVWNGRGSPEPLGRALPHVLKVSILILRPTTVLHSCAALHRAVLVNAEVPSPSSAPE